jgi:hypothetical protein
MNVSPASSAMSGIAAAQSMFGAAAQVASGISAGGGSGAAAEAVQVAMLQKALEMERSSVDILA